MISSTTFLQKSYADLFESRLYFPLDSAKQVKDYKRFLKKIKNGQEMPSCPQSLEPRRIELIVSLQEELGSYAPEEHHVEYFALFQEKVSERIKSLQEIDENTFFREEKACKRQREDAEILKRKCRKRQEYLERDKTPVDLESLEHQELQRRFEIEASPLAEIFGLRETLLLSKNQISILSKPKTLSTLKRLFEFGFKLQELENIPLFLVRRFFLSLEEKVPGWSLKTKKEHYISLLQKGMHTSFYLSLSQEMQQLLLDSPTNYLPIFEADIDLSLAPKLTPSFQILLFEKLLLSGERQQNLDLSVFHLDCLASIGEKKGWLKQGDRTRLRDEAKKRNSFSKLYEVIDYQNEYRSCYLQLTRVFRSKEQVEAFFSFQEEMRLFFLDHLPNLLLLQREAIYFDALSHMATSSLIRILIKNPEKLIALKKRSPNMYPRPEGISEDFYRLLVLKQQALDPLEEQGASLEAILGLPQDTQELLLRHIEGVSILIREISFERLISFPLPFLEQLLVNANGACALLYAGISLAWLSKMQRPEWRRLILEKGEAFLCMRSEATSLLAQIFEEASSLRKGLLEAVECLPFLQEQGVWACENPNLRKELLSYPKSVEALLKGGLTLQEIASFPLRKPLLEYGENLGRWLEIGVLFEEIQRLILEEFTPFSEEEPSYSYPFISNSLQISYLLESGVSLDQLKTLSDENLALCVNFGENLFILHINGYSLEELLAEEAFNFQTRRLLIEKASKWLYLMENSPIGKEAFDKLSFSEKEELLHCPEAICCWLSQGNSLDDFYSLPASKRAVYKEHYHTLFPLLLRHDFEELEAESSQMQALLYRYGEFFSLLEREGALFGEEDLSYMEELLSKKEAGRLICSGWKLQELLLFPTSRLDSLIEEL